MACTDFGPLVSIVEAGLCGRRGLDMAKVRSYLRRNGFDADYGHRGGEILLFFGCAFNRSNEKHSLSRLNELAEKYRKVFVLEGLSMTVSPDAMLKEPHPELVIIPMDNMNRLDQYFARNIRYADCDEENFSCFSPQGSQTWYVQVGHGCADACSYCGDKKVVGALRSKPLEKVIAECRAGLNKGFASIRLLGDDVGVYGLDLGVSVFDLLEQITALSGLESLAIEEINIKYLIKDPGQLKKIASRDKFDTFCVAFQHANNDVLARMNRGYTREEVENLLAILHNAGVEVRFHAIICFPGETEAQFMELLQFLDTQKLKEGDIFIYQKRDYAPAAAFDGHLPQEDVRRRIESAKNLLTRDGYNVSPHFLGDDYLPDKLVITKKSDFEEDADIQKIGFIDKDFIEKIQAQGHTFQSSEQWQDLAMEFQSPHDFSDKRIILTVYNQGDSEVSLRLALLSFAEDKEAVCEKWFTFEPGLTVYSIPTGNLDTLTGTPNLQKTKKLLLGGSLPRGSVVSRVDW